MKFKIGDKIKCKIGGLDVWVKGGEEYEVLNVTTAPAEPANPCYRNCGHSMHDAKPEKHYVVVNGSLGKCTILEDCFDRVID